MTQERKHKKYSPSQADRTFMCTGSRALLDRVPARPSGAFALEGTDAHTVFEAAIKYRVSNAEVAHKEYVPQLILEDLDNGYNDFYRAIQEALDYVFGLLADNPDALIWVENFVNPPTPSAPGEAAGYSDCIIWLPSKRELHIIDYKHGVGVTKRAKSNRQATQYAAGVLFEDNARVDPNIVEAVVLTIIQPRSFHADGEVRTYSVPVYEVWDYLQELDEKIAESEEGYGTLVPGEVQCQFCDARTLCPAREALGLNVALPGVDQIEQFAESELPHPSSLDMQRLAQIRYHAPALRKWLDDVDKHTNELARGGHVVPGAKLVETQAKRKWYGTEPEAAKRLAAMLGERKSEEAIDAYFALVKHFPVLDKMYTQKLIPLTTAEALVVDAYKQRVGRGRKKKAAEEARQAFAFLTLKQTSGNLVLVDEDDPRPAINKAQNTFGQIAGALQIPKS